MVAKGQNTEVTSMSKKKKKRMIGKREIGSDVLWGKSPVGGKSASDGGKGGDLVSRRGGCRWNKGKEKDA